MKILVTGATGYIGNKLALTLAEKGNTVHVLVRNPDSPHLPKHQNIRVFTGDITDRTTVDHAIQDCKQVYHTAALVKLFDKNPDMFYQVNVEGTRNILAAALEAGVKKLVFTSSCGVMGASLKEPRTENDPRIHAFENEYEFTKFLAENLVKEYVQKGLFSVIVSPSKVFGPGINSHAGSLNRIIQNFIKNKWVFIPKPGTLKHNYCFIDDVVEGHILAMENGIGGEKYILGGENISFAGFFETIRSLSKTRSLMVEVPSLFVHIWATAAWIKYKLTGTEPVITNKGIQLFFCNKTFKSEKAIRQLGYHLTPLRVGLEKTIQFLKKQDHEK